MSLVSIPEQLWAYPELGKALVELTGDAIVKGQGGYTWPEIRSIAIQAAATYVTVAKSYSQLTGAQKAALVDLALASLLQHLEPLIIGTVATFVSSAFPWYLRFIPWVLSYFIKTDLLGQLIEEIPAIRQSVYDGLKAIWIQHAV
jgi:hypothetical protein